MSELKITSEKLSFFSLLNFGKKKMDHELVNNRNNNKPLFPEIVGKWVKIDLINLTSHW